MNTFEIIWLILAFGIGWIVFDVTVAAIKVLTPPWFRPFMGAVGVMVAYTILTHF